MSATNCPREFAMSHKEAEDRLREAVCFNDVETICTLIQRGTNVNSKNAVNEWTALHWAGKRNNLEVVRLLLANGADPNIRNADGKIPGQLSTQPAVRSLLGVSDPVEDGVGEPLDIIPNYLAHPQLNYRVDIGARNPIINFRNGLGTPAASSSPIVDELVLKVRIAGMDDDFIEIDVPKSDLTYENLLSTACAELEIPDQTRVKRIRKLPNTIVRRDKDVTRLGPFQEIELIMTDHR